MFKYFFFRVNRLYLGLRTLSQEEFFIKVHQPLGHTDNVQDPSANTIYSSIRFR